MSDAVDPRIDSPGREGLTGTARSSVYEPAAEREQITLPPDGRPDSAQPAWRGDFPVDWPADQYVARRDFTRFLVRRRDGTLLAYGQKCTHLSCAVIPDPDRGVIRCPCHEGLFDLGSGRPIAGPPPRPLPRVTLEVRRGEVYATGIEERTV